MTKLYTFLIFLVFASTLKGQVMEVSNSAPITPENLISNVFLGDGVEVVSITYDGDDEAVGLFTNGIEDIGMDRGIVMTTGVAVSGPGGVGVNSPGTSQAAEGNNSNAQDADLQSIVGNGTSINDVSKYTIEFIPTNDTLQFTYSFASEEYPEFVCSSFNDVFGFFISGPGINGPYENGGKNIALIPGTSRPVTINNINPGVVGNNGTLANCQGAAGSLAFSQYYNNNQTISFPVYDGYTDVLIAQAIVMPCSLYTIKLVLADAADGSHDSGVFLEAKSFGTGSLDVEIDGLAVDGGLAEGCALGQITFTLPQPTESDYDIELEVSGTATPNVDYPALPANIIIPEGDSTTSIFLSAFDDDIIENDETIVISVKRDACNRDTFTIVIKDNILEKPDLGPDLTVCPSDETQLMGMVDVPLPDPLRFENNTPLEISTHNTPFVSEIEVFGVLPIELGPEAILSICIDSLEHAWIDDLDIFLVTPGGQFMELTTDNGADGANGLGPDYYLGTCFTVDATTPINSPGPFAPGSAAPFTGNWLPEGVWSDLWDGNNPTNGTWQLVITDDFQTGVGTLFSWSITFNAVYQIDYDWTPSTGLSCNDCPDPIASPDASTTYIVTAMDSYGCTERDTIHFDVIPALPMSELQCGLATTSSVEVLWDDVIGSTGYEVSINGGPWMAANGVLTHTVNGLGLSENVEIIVRALADCPSFPDTIICTSLACTPASLTASPNSVSCYDGNDGSVQINILSGTAPFTYSLGLETNDNGLFSNLNADTYIAMVTDGNDCTGPVQFTIEEPLQPVFTPITEQFLNCNGDSNGALTVDVENGNGPFVFNWNNATADSIATSLSAGIYNVQLTDAANCLYDVDFVLEEPILLEASIEATDALCANSSTGQAWVSPTGGTGSYSYLWNDGQLQDTAFLLAANPYDVTVTDDLNCEVILNIEINEPNMLTTTTTAIEQACTGPANGQAIVNPAGGTPPYFYAWDNGQTTPNASNLTAGGYAVTITDSQNCSIITNVTVPMAETVSISNATATDVSCFGGNDGSIDVELTGGTAPFTWNQPLNSLQTGNYSLTVTDANNCTDVLEIFINESSQLILDTDITHVVC